MMFTEFLFFFFSGLLIASALLVVSSRNPVRAVLSLVLCFFCASFLWMLLEAEFLSIILILVYVGAVMVLFLFVVMMLNIRVSEAASHFVRHWPLTAALAVIFVFQLCWVFGGGHLPKVFEMQLVPHGPHFNSIKELGRLLFTGYVYPFEIAGVILLVAIVAAIALTFRGPGVRRLQNPSQQIAATQASRLRLSKGISPE